MQIVDIIASNHGVSVEDIEKAKSFQSKYGGRVEQILVSMGSFPEEELSDLYTTYIGAPTFKLDDWLDTEPNTYFEARYQPIIEKGWLPLKECNNEVHVVCAYPLDLFVNEFFVKHNITPVVYVAPDTDIQLLKSRFEESNTSNFSGSTNHLVGDEEERLVELASEAPTVNLLNSLISKAIRQGASDMHLEPFRGQYRVRYRIDGVLHDVDFLPRGMDLPIVTRLKILSDMDIAEKRRPQDGKIEMRISNQDLDIRVSALPLNDGESVVMRFLRKDNVQYDMSVLGLSNDIETLIHEDIKKTAGVVLLTGPTGSGKTTTLYTFLNALNGSDVKIVTLEDPVEYQLPGINQVQVNSDIGFDFAAGLRSIVRQDPDIIMLGEIRDKETAKIALQSALTGHLVFSTVHTNDAASAYTRLLDLGVDEFLLNAALVSIVAQRLARKLCEHCSVPHQDQSAIFEKYGLQELATRFELTNLNVREAVGCEHCGGSGYKGRMAITEYLRCDDDIKSMPKDADFIGKAKVHNKNMQRRTLLEDGLFKVLLGLTTVDEVVRVSG